MATQRRAALASTASPRPSRAASVQSQAAGSVASMAWSAATGSSISVVATAAMAGHHRGAVMSR
jgi:pseudouridine-5'-phosphate glycosidase